ncbi:MAG: DNA polymerase/3'-5' exonuclease PolX [Candidatus Omnitrophica bacterium]|nr:DNA polymerase/3'-5' exonuclease PolX [Candidatus Omnitrophota bacterium]
MTNKQISDIFLRIADALEIKDENIFRVRAYRTAAQSISGLTRELSEIYREDSAELNNIPGIGKDLKKKIEEMVSTGKLEYYRTLMEEFPKGFLDMLDLAGLGPKKLIKLRDELNISNVHDLEIACIEGRLEKIEGMGLKTQEKLIASIKHFKKKEGRMLLPEAHERARDILSHLGRSGNFKKAEIAGSLRRGSETVGDIDILALADDEEKAMDHFAGYPYAERVIAKGMTKSSISLESGVQVDIRIVKEESFGAALLYFTGSKEHNVKLRALAKRKGWKVNEYGIFRVSKSGKETRVAGRTEEDVYSSLDMQWIPPELRENRGEIEAALEGTLPKDLVKVSDIKGDLHIHTTASDGKADIMDMIKAAKKKGYKYIAVTDHSKLIKIAGGMDEKRLLKRAEEIRKIAGREKGIKVLAGIEVDILEDGRLDLEDHALKELDIVVAAVHSKFSLKREEQTARILRAMDNKYVNILAHPSGRLITKRSAIELDFDSVFRKAAEKNIFMEINTHGERADLNDAHCARAKELGCRFAINTDAHETIQLDDMPYGIITARRGWLVKDDVLNTYSFSKLMKAIKR